MQKQWGEEGYFRIKWGSGGIGKIAPFIWDGAAEKNSFEVSPKQIDTQLIIGDSLTYPLWISNKRLWLE